MLSSGFAERLVRTRGAKSLIEALDVPADRIADREIDPCRAGQTRSAPRISLQKSLPHEVAIERWSRQAH